MFPAVEEKQNKKASITEISIFTLDLGGQ